MGEVDQVKVEQNGQVKDDWCHVLINGTGFLNSWKCELIGSEDLKNVLKLRKGRTSKDYMISREC